MLRNMELNRKMTEEERKLADKNHALIKSYANKHNLDYDEMYGILAEALCIAAMTYDSNKGKFSTHAFWQMKKAVGNYYTKEKYDNRFANTNSLSLNAVDKKNTFNEECPVTYLDNIQSKTNVEREAIVKDLLQCCIDEMTDKQKQIVQKLAECKTQKQIAKEMGVCQQNINNAISSMRRRLLRTICN